MALVPENDLPSNLVPENDLPGEAPFSIKTSPVGRDLATIPKAFVHAVTKQLPNALSHFVSAGDSALVSDEEVKRSANEMRNSPEYGGLGEFVGQVGAALPAGALTAPAKAGLLLRTLARGGSGALQGATFSDPGQRTENAAIGGVAGPVIGAAGDALSALASSALPRAQRMAVRLFKPTPDDIGRIEAQSTVEEAGKALMDVGATKPGMSMRDRRNFLKEVGQEAGNRIEDALQTAHYRGASMDKPALMEKLQNVYDDIFAQPGAPSNLTRSLYGGSKEARNFIDVLRTDPDMAPGVIRPSFVENAKRKAQVEGFLKGGKYADPAAGKKDPGAAFMRQASHPLKEATEDSLRAIDPALAEQFIADKAVSGTAQSFFPMAGSAFNKTFAGEGGLPQHAFSARSAAFRSLWDALINPARPYMIPANQLLDKAGNAIPEGTADALRLATIEMLRQKERP
jgi:hypothetical protein